jgi:hypothetical protein
MSEEEKKPEDKKDGFELQRRIENLKYEAWINEKKQTNFKISILLWIALGVCLLIFGFWKLHN